MKSIRDRVRERAEKRRSAGGSTNYLLIPEDAQMFEAKEKMTIDILPYKVSVDNHPEVKKGDLWYQRTIYVHYNVGAEGHSAMCPSTIKKKCPICEYRNKLLRDEKADEDLIKQLKPKERELFNVLDMDDQDAGIQVWEYSFHNFGKILEEELRSGDEENASFADLEGGKTLKVRFTKEKMGKNNFLKASRIDFEDRDDYDEETLDNVYDLDKMLNIMSYDDLKAMFLETMDTGEEAEEEVVEEDAPEEEAEEEVEEAPKKKLVKKSRQVEEEVEEEPAEEEEAEEEVEEEEEPAPKKKLLKKSRHVEEEEEAEETEDDKCPEGGVFGEDCEDLTACEDCKLWDKCKDKKDELLEEKKKKKMKK